ncbi:M1 family metallopeptidase [Flaviaesturariibacter aridisoli]|uniref:M1 family peptidase n=1 Tax=Flaviaesturariibacter aridisoli TaxID=2545761 RepID=A0A4R4E5C4_9BACT|nr:M1 family metallopeptidase [Flaviaesturariibacter aridisoli]TCZ74217.1 M1 family peptidase [Flaviaesturariibacter aridisoli]
MKKLLIACGVQLLAGGFVWAQNPVNNPGSNHGNKFEQLGTTMPTPNEYRTASGAPGPKYWQQRTDYDIRATLDEPNLTLRGSETVTYYNNSPDVLSFLWLQLDENEHSSTKNAGYQANSAMPRNASVGQLENIERQRGENGLGVNILKLTDAAGNTLHYTINKTMMRVELPVPLKPGQKFVFNCDWNYKIPDRLTLGGRGGYEYFPEDGNHLFTITQWYPRLCVYSDFQGWQNHQFTGRGEFAVGFGNFKVAMTVPADHIVGATGLCQNLQQVLTPAQFARWNKAQTSSEPVEIVTLAEAKAAEKGKSTKTETWIFKADNVRDFAWGSSRKFVWDAMAADVEGKKVLCMSLYGKEAYSLYRKYSSKAVAHTIKTYSKFTIPYPYPVAQSVEAANGMEYPMICFNYGRTEKDGSYSENTKNGMLGVVIHEVGHNFFPMIINSDERQWTWMDEGLNTFVEYLTEELWDNKFPSRRGPAFTITDYMKLPKDQLEPIMTNSENIHPAGFGPNAYSKPATGLNMLRETIMGRELFDYAFKEYARRWAFKHPTPADFFRTMEDASAEDLDWFWRGWFYSTDVTDISLDSVKYAKADAVMNSARMRDTTVMVPLPKPQLNAFEDVSKIRNREDKHIRFATDADTSLRDFYWRYDRGLEPVDTARYASAVPASQEPLDDATKAKYAGKHFYELSFSNKGGLVMPIIVEWTYEDGTKEVERIPAQVWRHNENKVTKFFMKDKRVTGIKLDPMRETADIDESNNSWGNPDAQPSRFQLFKAKQGAARGQSTGVNPMQKSAEKKGF